jgi:serine/threonine protein phosphatase 1
MAVSIDITPWLPAPFELGGETVFAVGDVHGCAEHLDLLLDTIAGLAREATALRHLVYLGDMIDRGPDTIGVLRLWAEGPEARGVDQVHRVIGNHEILMMLALRGRALASKATKMWLSERMGGGKVLAEMRAAAGAPLAPLGLELARAALGRRIIDLLEGQLPRLRLGNTLFVHGGLDGRSDPRLFLARPWTAGVNARWAWITRGFLDWEGGFGGTLVVHGHTPPAKHRKYSGMADTNVFAHDRLCLDGGSALTGVVVAAEIQDGRYRLLKART